MKKIAFVFLLLCPWLFGEATGMAEFRLQQRQLALAEFKSLYKQRHYYRHRARALRHHRRVKTIGKHSVWTHMRSESEQDTPVTQPMMHENDLTNGHESNLKTRANHDMEWIKQEEAGHGLPDPDRPFNPPFEPHDGGASDGGDMPQWPAGGGNTPTDGAGGDPNPSDGGSHGTESLFPSGTGDGVQGTSEISDTTGSQWSTSEPDIGSMKTTAQEKSEKTGDTPESSWTEDTLRPRFADPWRRR